MEQIRRRIRPMMSVSVAPALLSAIDSLTRVTGEPRSHLVERLLWAALAREPHTGGALRSRLEGAAVLRYLGEPANSRRRQPRRAGAERG